MRFLPCLAAAMMLLPLAAPAMATTISPTFGDARAEVVDKTALCANTTTCVVGVETYNSRTTADFTNGFTTDFGTGGVISGTFKAATGANVKVVLADAYGGASQPTGTAGSYAELFSGSYNLTLSTKGVAGVNYFGLWISALDDNNDLQFYSNGILVLDFTPTLMKTYIAKMSNGSAYYGNPENGKDTGEYFSFVNFIATDGTFDTVVFKNLGSSGFESDNATVAYRTPSATVFGNAIPEPGTLLLVAAGLAGLGVTARRRSSFPA